MSKKNDGFVMVFTSPNSDETTQLPLPAPKGPEQRDTVLWLVLKALKFFAWAAAV